MAFQLFNNVFGRDKYRMGRTAATPQKKTFNEYITGGQSTAQQQQQAAAYQQNAERILKQNAKEGKNAIRPYFYGLGKKYGLSQDKIDSMLSFDNDTQEVSFNGKNIGKPYSIVDGVSYWDSDKLDDAFNDYLKNGYKADDEYSEIVNQRNNIYGKYNDLYDYNMNTKPLETDEAKSILARYDLKAMQGRENEMASGAASNGGNVDSYAAANALRQQAAMQALGEQSALAAYNNRISNAMGILEGMGVNVDRGYNQWRTNRLDDFDMEQTRNINNANIRAKDMETYATQAGITGYVPTELISKDNPYFNSDGTLKNVKMDYAQILNDLQAELDSTEDPAKRESIARDMTYAQQARFAKTQLQEYAQYFDGKTGMTPQKSYEHTRDDANDALAREELAVQERMNKANNESAERITGAKNTSAEKIAETEQKAELDKNNKEYDLGLKQLSATADAGGTIPAGGSTEGFNEKGKPILTRNQVLEEYNKGNHSAYIVNQYNYYTGKNVQPKKTELESALSGLPDDVINKWVKYFIEAQTNKYSAERKARDVLSATDLTEASQRFLLKALGVSDDAINSALTNPHYQ